MSEQVGKSFEATFLVPSVMGGKAIQSGRVVHESDYDALHQQVEGLMATYVALVDKLGVDTEAAKSAPGKPSDVIVSYVEALRAENERLNREADESLAALVNQRDKARTELEAARGLLRDIAPLFAAPYGRDDLHHRLDAFLTATPAPEVRQDGHACELSRAMDGSCFACKAEQGERQEAVAWETRCNTERRFSVNQCSAEERAEHWRKNGRGVVSVTPLFYTSPPPAQDVSGLVEALKEAAAELEDWRMSFPDANATVTDGLLVRIDNLISAHRNPATVKRCPTCAGSCAEICKEARP